MRDSLLVSMWDLIEQYKKEADIEELSFKENMSLYKRFSLIKFDRHKLYSSVSILDRKTGMYYKDLTPIEATKIMYNITQN